MNLYGKSGGGRILLREYNRNQVLGKTYINESVREVGGGRILSKKSNRKKVLGKTYINESVREVRGGEFY